MLKKLGKKAEKLVREVRDEVTSAVNEKVLEKATKDYKNDANDRADAINRQQDAIAGVMRDSQSKWDLVLNDEHFPKDTNKDFIREKLSTLSTKFVLLTAHSAAVEQQRQNIIARPADGSSSATSAENDCENFLTAQQVAAGEFTKVYQELQKELSLYNQVREKLAVDIMQQKELAALEAETAALLLSTKSPVLKFSASPATTSTNPFDHIVVEDEDTDPDGFVNIKSSTPPPGF